MHHLPLITRLTEYEPAAWEQIPDLGLYMDQVVTYLERQFEPLFEKGVITPSMINNYVKTGLLDRPLGKKYYREHLALLMMIVTLKPVSSMDDIARLIARRQGETVEQLYAEFRLTQEQVFRSISIEPGAGALRHAVTATAYRLITEALLSEADG